MNKKYIVGMDIGTTGAKTLVFDFDGHVVGSGYSEYGCRYPHPGWVEQDPADLVDGAYASARQAVEESGVDPAAIASIGLSAQRCSVIFLDGTNRPLNMISWQDTRAVEETRTVEQKIGQDRFYRITGLPNSTTWILPKIMWTRANTPDVWENTERMVQVHDFVLKALGAEDYYVDHDDACFFGCWNTDRHEWDSEIMAAFDLAPEQFSIPMASAQAVGFISRYAADRTGFAEGTPLCIGSGDQNCASIGAGIVKPGMVSVSLGTGGMATAFLDRPYRDPMGCSMVVCHAVKGKWELEGFQNGAAGVFRWFRDEIADKVKADAEQTDTDVYMKLNEMIRKVPPGAKGLLLLPYFASAGAPRWDADARGTLLGLTFAHDKACVARAFMEGITMEQKDILAGMKSAGIGLDTVRIMGGATKSSLWNQIQADMYDMPVETLQVADAAVLGAAICGAVGVGLFGDITEAAEALVKVGQRYQPNPEAVEIYNQKYDVYCRAYTALKEADVFRRISNEQKIYG